MAGIIKVYRQPLPRMRFIGKRYADIGHWDEWFQNDWFGLIETAAGEERLKALYEDAGAYIGLMSRRNGEHDAYLIGEFVPADTAVPEGFEALDFEEGAVGVCWIKGQEAEVYPAEGGCLAALAEQELLPAADEDGIEWMFERYACPRFTVPDESGEIILDYCVYIK